MWHVVTVVPNLIFRGLSVYGSASSAFGASLFFNNGSERISANGDVIELDGGVWYASFYSFSFVDAPGFNVTYVAGKKKAGNKHNNFFKLVLCKNES